MTDMRLDRAILDTEFQTFRATFTRPGAPRTTVVLRFLAARSYRGYLDYSARVVGQLPVYTATVPVPIDAPASLSNNERYDGVLATVIAYALADNETRHDDFRRRGTAEALTDLLTSAYLTIPNHGRRTLAIIFYGDAPTERKTLAPYADTLLPPSAFAAVLSARTEARTYRLAS